MSRPKIQAQQEAEHKSLVKRRSQVERKLTELSLVRQTYGDDLYQFVKLMLDAYPEDNVESVMAEVSDQLGVSREVLRSYWDERIAGKQVYPSGRFKCNNLKLLDQSSYTYLTPDNQLIVDENNDCFTFDEFMAMYQAARDQGNSFNSPYRSRITFSDIAPKYLRGQDISPYLFGNKLHKFAEDNQPAAAPAPAPLTRRPNWQSIWSSRDRGGWAAFREDYDDIRTRYSNNHFVILSRLRDRVEADGRFEMWWRHIMETDPEAPRQPPERRAVRVRVRVRAN